MKKIITTPITYDQLKDLTAGDTVYLTGKLATCRDAGHRRVIKENIMPEHFDFNGGAIFHAGPIVRTNPDGTFTMISIGPTTSRRMEPAEAEFIEKTGVKMIIGKGGMLDKTTEACKKFGAVHCAFPGGCAIIAADRVKDTYGVEWMDFGMPEALWEMDVEEFGPLIVSIDTKGNNLFENNKVAFSDRVKKLKEDL